MAKKSEHGPIIVIDDDADDQDLTREVIASIGVKNEVISFSNCHDAFDYLMENLDIQPFIILSDVNLPKLNGIELKAKIDNTPVLRQKSIPFVFHSTSADKATVDKAYEYSVQGFFLKGDSIASLKSNLGLILDYWRVCRHPNS